MYISRDIEAKLNQFINRKEAIAIVGPRQAGKTTLLKELEKGQTMVGKKVKFVSFENHNDLNLFQTDLNSFIELNKNYDILIIDEFQYAKNGGKKLKFLVDTTPIKYIISGSSSLELTFQTGRYMVGRLLSFELLPFSLREYLSAKDNDLLQLVNNKVPEVLSPVVPSDIFTSAINERLRSHFEDYLVWGGYPAVVLAKAGFEKEKLLESIVSNYLLKDIGSLLKLATEDELLKLTNFLATQLSSLINYKELSNVADLQFKNLKNHLKILAETYIIDLIKPFYSNKRTELVKNPKVYFYDSGFRNFIISDFRKPITRSDTGALVESFVLGALRRREVKSINFWRTKSGAEVDFVIQGKDGITPIDVKYSNKPTIGKNLYSFINKFEPKQAFILTKQDYGNLKVKDTTVNLLPVYYL